MTSQGDPLEAIFTGLKNKNPEARLASAIELQRYVRMAMLCQLGLDICSLLLLRNRSRIQ
jgi:hypothetical protein